MGIVLLGILVFGMFVIGFLINKQNVDDKQTDPKQPKQKPIKLIDENITDDIQRLKIKYGIIPKLEFSEMPIKDKESYIKQLIEQIESKVVKLHSKGILSSGELAKTIRAKKIWQHKEYLYIASSEYSEKPSNVFYVIYKSLLTHSLVPMINKDYTFAIDKEFFSFMILNDFFMTGEFRSTSNILNRMNIKNFKFDTHGFEELYQDLKPYLDRISTNSSYSTVRVSQSLNRYIKLSEGESHRIKLELGSDFEEKRITDYCNEIHFLEILGYDFLIKYLKKYLDMLQRLEDNADTKSGYSQYLSKYNLTIH